MNKSFHLLVILASLSCLIARPGLGRAIPAFDQELDRIGDMEVAKVGKESVVSQLVRLVEAYPAEPRRGEAMLRIARTLELGSGRTSKDEASALDWYKKAVANSPVGSNVWLESQFCVVHRVMRSDTRLARQILVAVQKSAGSDVLTAARVESELQECCIIEGDILTAEAHFARIFRWFDDPSRVPKSFDSRQELSDLRGRAASRIVNAHIGLPGSKAERRKRIIDFTEKYGLAHERAYALEVLEAADETPQPVPGAVPIADGTKTMLFGLGLIPLVAVVWFVVIRNRRS